MTMHHFSRALSADLAGPPRRTQNDLAGRAGFDSSKLCRILQNRIRCDRDALDQILTAIPDLQVRQTLVKAYITDNCSPGALLHLNPTPQGLWDGFDQPLTPKERAALQAILTGPHARAFGKILLSLSEAWTE